MKNQLGITLRYLRPLSSLFLHVTVMIRKLSRQPWNLGVGTVYATVAVHCGAGGWTLTLARVLGTGPCIYSPRSTSAQ